MEESQDNIRHKMAHFMGQTAAMIRTHMTEDGAEYMADLSEVLEKEEVYKSVHDRMKALVVSFDEEDIPNNVLSMVFGSFLMQILFLDLAEYTDEKKEDAVVNQDVISNVIACGAAILTTELASFCKEDEADNEYFNKGYEAVMARHQFMKSLQDFMEHAQGNITNEGGEDGSRGDDNDVNEARAHEEWVERLARELAGDSEEPPGSGAVREEGEPGETPDS